MIKKTILSLFLTFLCTAGFAQSEIYVYQNDFSDPYHFFSETTDSDGKIWCKNGKYHMEYYDTAGTWRQTQTAYFNPNEDYTIESSIVLLKHSTNHGYGMAYGYKDLKNANYFVCSANGYFRIFSYEKDKQTVIVDWKKSDAVKGPGLYNTFQVKRKGGTFYYYINDTEVASSSLPKIYENKVGFYVGSNMTIEADYLNVMQKRKPVNLIENHDKFGEKEHLGPEINSKFGEKHPVISPDGKSLYVNREDHPGNVGGPKEDIWVADLEDGKWGELRNVGWPLNNKDFNYVAGISADNTTLLLGNVYSDDLTSMKEGYSIAYRTKKGWSIPKGVKIKNYYNNNKYNGACLSADKKILIITVERDDTHGEKDLYVCFRNADSSWTEPMNMGSVINSWSAEFGPYLAPDNKTLYFASYGHPGYGESDIFVSKRLDESWKNWSVPQNLGPKVNTKYWDGYISISAEADYVYISSTEHGRNDLDCYRVKLPKTASPDPLVLLHGKVFNEKTKQPLDAAIRLVDASNGKVVKELDAGDATGEYSAFIDKAGKYFIESQHDGYIAIHRTIEVGEIKEYKEMKLDLFLTPLEKGATIVLNNIFFPPNKFDLLPESFEELNKLVKIMKDNPAVKIQVSGHTSRNSEGEKFNEELSTNRALAVRTYLIQNGIQDARVIHKGYGYSKPLYLEVDEQHQALNRRVEITVLEK